LLDLYFAVSVKRAMKSYKNREFYFEMSQLGIQNFARRNENDAILFESSDCAG
jgi:hypothetical protein